MRQSDLWEAQKVGAGEGHDQLEDGYLGQGYWLNILDSLSHTFTALSDRIEISFLKAQLDTIKSFS